MNLVFFAKQIFHPSAGSIRNLALQSLSGSTLIHILHRGRQDSTHGRHKLCHNLTLAHGQRDKMTDSFRLRESFLGAEYILNTPYNENWNRLGCHLAQ